MDLQSFLILVVPVAFGTFKSLACIVGGIPSKGAKPVGVDDQVAFGTVQTGGSAVDVVRTGTDGCALGRVGTC